MSCPEMQTEDGTVATCGTAVTGLIRQMVAVWNKPHLVPDDYPWRDDEIHPLNFRLADAQVPHDHLRYLFWLLDRNYDLACEAQSGNWDANDYNEARRMVHLFAEANQIVILK